MNCGGEINKKKLIFAVLASKYVINFLISNVQNLTMREKRRPFYHKSYHRYMKYY